MVRPLRATFDEDAERYDRARPGYPAELFDDLAALTGLKPGDRVLEIGPGTGQATVPLARRGYRIVAVELGAGLAAVARRNLARFPDVEVVNAAFEQWPLPAEPFDAVVSATAFHWIDPEARLARTADALRPGGALVVVTTHHVAGGDEAFFAAVQDCYERFMPGTAPGERLPPASGVPTLEAELEEGGRFAVAAMRRYERDIPYTSAEYLDVLATYSNHIALAREPRDKLFACIAALIDGHHGGRIAKRYLFELAVATRNRP
jgi:SAM-dependent methyltransferase